MTAESASNEMSCEQAQVAASAWIDGELRDAATWNAHVAHCADCRAHVDELHEIRRRLEPLRALDAEPNTWPRIAASVAGSSTRSLERTRSLVRIAAALVGFAATLAALRELTRSTTAPPSPHWAEALRETARAQGSLDTLPEQRLLAALELGAQERK